MTETTQWEVRWEGLLPAGPPKVWAAVTATPSGHLWPIEYEPFAGAADRDAAAAAWSARLAEVTA